MEPNKKNNLVRGFAFGSIIASVFVTLVTILGELIPPLKDFLKEQHHHHWVGKGIWTVIIFVVTALLVFVATRRRQCTNEQIAKWVTLVTWFVIMGSVILLLFFTYEYVVHH